MNKQPEYFWNSEQGMAFCTIYYNQYTFTGEAQCHPDDKDMMSKLTGQTIAEFRATIKYLRFVRDCELRPQLKSLKQLYYSMKHSKHYNKKSYEAKMLYRQIRFLEEDIDVVNIELDNLKQSLKEYIVLKEKDHQQIRAFYEKRKQLAENEQ